jgi:hypothetical protein
VKSTAAPAARHVHEGERHAEPSAHPLGQALRQAIAHVFEQQPFHELGPAGFRIGRGPPVQAGVEREQSPGGSAAGDARALQGDAEELTDRRGLGDGVVAGDAHRPAVGAQQGRDDPDGRRLARAVGAKQGDGLSGTHAKCHVFESGDRSEPPGDPVELKHAAVASSSRTTLHQIMVQW